MNEELEFYYDRNKRLENAPHNVKAHYDGTEPKLPKGFFKVLVHTPASRFLLSAIGLFVVVVFITRFFSGQENSNTFQGIKMSLSAFSFEEKIYVSLHADAQNSQSKDAAQVRQLHILFSAFGAENIPLADTEIQVIYDGNENFYRTTFIDYDILYVKVDVSEKGESVSLRTTVSRK